MARLRITSERSVFGIDGPTFREKLLEVFFDSDLVATKFLLGMACFIWCGLLMWPGDLFARPTYTIMRYLMPQWMWAVAFLCHGIMLMNCVFFHRGWAKLNFVLGPVLGSLIWTSSCIAMFASIYPPPAAISAEVASALASWWILVRYKGDAHG